LGQVGLDGDVSEMSETRDWSLSPERDLLQLDRVHEWLRTSYWSPGVLRDVLERAFANSIFIGAYDDAGLQVGVARAVTDFATFGWLCDVFVDEQWRGKGIGKAMVRALLDDDRLQTLRRWMLGTQDAHTVYEAVGFEDVESGRYMKLVRDAATWSTG
jgi:GNAT superfamily N-acetyltransferase